jgi:uncharacterized membrane protein
LDLDFVCAVFAGGSVLVAGGLVAVSDARHGARGSYERRFGAPARYWRYERVWVILGIPAFAALFVVFFLMVAKPVF